MASYPYDNLPNNKTSGYGKSPDDEVFKHLAIVYSQNHPKMRLKKVPSCASWHLFEGGKNDLKLCFFYKLFTIYCW